MTDTRVELETNLTSKATLHNKPIVSLFISYSAVQEREWLEGFSKGLKAFLFYYTTLLWLSSSILALNMKSNAFESWHIQCYSLVSVRPMHALSFIIILHKILKLHKLHYELIKKFAKFYQFIDKTTTFTKIFRK